MWAEVDDHEEAIELASHVDKLAAERVDAVKAEFGDAIVDSILQYVGTNYWILNETTPAT